MSQGYVVVIPVKAPGLSKTRLTSVPAGARGALASAFATDTITACLDAGVSEVLVATDDDDTARLATGLGAATCPDGTGTGLNAALRHAAAVARARRPRCRPVAVLADLPALRPAELSAALATLPVDAAYVADAEGTGTTLYSAPYDAFDPRFGADSAAAHAAAGATALLEAGPGLRRDVDDLATLQAAVTLGVGRATSALLPALTVDS